MKSKSYKLFIPSAFRIKITLHKLIRYISGILVVFISLMKQCSVYKR